MCIVLNYGFPRSGIAALYGSSMFSFSRNLHIAPHDGCTNLHSVSPTSPTFIVCILFDDGRSEWCTVLICIFLIISNVGHLFMYLLVICISFLEKCLFRSSAHFLIGLFVCFLVIEHMSC